MTSTACVWPVQKPFDRIDLGYNEKTQKNVVKYVDAVTKYMIWNPPELNEDPAPGMQLLSNDFNQMEKSINEAHLNQDKEFKFDNVRMIYSAFAKLHKIINRKRKYNTSQINLLNEKIDLVLKAILLKTDFNQEGIDLEFLPIRINTLFVCKLNDLKNEIAFHENNANEEVPLTNWKWKILTVVFALIAIGVFAAITTGVILLTLPVVSKSMIFFGSLLLTGVNISIIISKLWPDQQNQVPSNLKIDIENLKNEVLKYGKIKIELIEKSRLTFDGFDEYLQHLDQQYFSCLDALLTEVNKFEAG